METCIDASASWILLKFFLITKRLIQLCYLQSRMYYCLYLLRLTNCFKNICKTCYFPKRCGPLYYVFLYICAFFHEHSRFTGQQGKGEATSLIPLYHFHPLHRHLNISRLITAESSPLHLASKRTLTGNIWYPSASR